MLSFPRNPSDLEKSHGLANRRDLLPYEAELCNTVGLSPEEYFTFLAEAKAVPVKREGYEHIPDIRCEPTTLAIVQLVVGLALTAASALLTPKPRSSSDERVDIKRPDQLGPNRFTPTFAFDTVQELAKLGQTVPLIFADQTPLLQSDQIDEDVTVLRGGTRANSLMTFSMLSSTGGGQRFRIFGVAGFCGNRENQIGEKPEYDGLAFGDQLVRDYNPGRIAAYFRGHRKNSGQTNDGPIGRGDKYKLEGADYQLQPPDGDPSLVYWHPFGGYAKAFSGARNPSNETEFGAYSPLPNANYWKLDFQMYILPDVAKSDEKDRVRSLRQKISADFPLYGAVTDISGDKVTYELNSTDNKWEDFFEAKGGVTGEDIANQVNQQRLNIDAMLNEGEAYILNNQVGILISKTSNPFVPGESGASVKCTFQLTQDGAGAPPTKIENKNNGKTIRVEGKKPYDRAIRHWRKDANQIQKFSDAIVANNVACDCTEIGIGSTVWKKIQGANVNNFPGSDFIGNLENNDAGGSYDLGRIDAYITRYSFFNIQLRRQGELDWSENINGGGVFAVKGNTPVERFNAIRIYHPRGQYEYRLRPYPSKLAYFRHKDNDKNIYLLDSRDGLDQARSATRIPDPPDGFNVYFEGRILNIKDPGLVTNKETIKGEENAKNYTYEVTSVSPTQWSPVSDIGTGQWDNDPVSGNPNYVGPTYGNPTFNNNCARYMVLRRIMHNERKQRYVYFWAGDKVGDIEISGINKPSDEDLIAYQTKFEDAGCGTRTNNDTIRYQPRSEVFRRAKNNVTKIETVYYQISRKKRNTALVPDGPKTIESARGGSGSGLTFKVQKYKNGSFTWTIDKTGKGYRDDDEVRISDIPDDDFKIKLQATQSISLDGGEDPDWWSVGDLSPLSMVTDYYSRNTESSSHQDSPEHRVTYVNEIVLAPDTVAHGNYRYLASLGFILQSSKRLTNLSQLSAYYQKGLRVKKFGKDYPFSSGTRGASNIFPEIAYFLLTNEITGAGGIINKEQIDQESFARAADFCRANQYYWDGVIDERVNLRDFIHEQASYCLLDFTMKGGKFGLEPTVPYHASDFRIKTNDDAIPEIKALFTDGNMREMSVTTLPPEERKLFEAEILYREERINQFPQTRTTSVRLERYRDDIAVETFDLTQFCTSRKQAVHFAKYALKSRQWIDHVIEFQTTPQSMSNVEPGDYVRIVSHLCHPDRFSTGHITDEGVIQSSQEIPNGTQVYYWNPSFTRDTTTNSFIRVGNLSIGSDGKAQNALRGCVIAVVSSTTSDRVYKVDSISIGEEGFVAVNATHMPVSGQGQLKVMTGWDDDRDFSINSSIST